MAEYPRHLVHEHTLFDGRRIDPACSIAFEAEPDDDAVMRQPPRAPSAHLFDFSTVLLSVLQGAGMLLAVAAVYGYALMHGAGPQARAMAFATIIFGNLTLILASRSRTRPILQTFSFANTAMWAIIAGTLGALILVLYVPYLRDLFQVAALSVGALLVCLMAALAVGQGSS